MRIQKFKQAEIFVVIVATLLGLAHIFSILKVLPNTIPFVADDLWYEWKGQTETFYYKLIRTSIGGSLDMGRSSYILLYYLTCISYRGGYFFRLVFQSAPILLLVFSSCLIFFENKSWKAMMSVFSLIAFGTFFFDHHHMIGAYPLAFSIGGSFCFLYFYFCSPQSNTPPSAKLALLFRIIVFAVPLFISEMFVAIQFMAISLHFLETTNFKFMYSDLKIFAHRIKPEIITMILWFILFLIFVFHPHEQYPGWVFSPSLADFLRAFYQFGSGFISTSNVLVGLILAIIFTSYWILVYRGNARKRSVATYLLGFWIIPTLLISLTPKYQAWAANGETIYVITYLCEIGFLCLSWYLVENLFKNYLKTPILILACVALYGMWRQPSEAAIVNRLNRFEKIDSEIRKAKSEGLRCFSFETASSILYPWRICHENNINCRPIMKYMLTRRGLDLCD